MKSLKILGNSERLNDGSSNEQNEKTLYFSRKTQENQKLNQNQKPKTLVGVGLK